MQKIKHYLGIKPIISSMVMVIFCVTYLFIYFNFQIYKYLPIWLSVALLYLPLMIATVFLFSLIWFVLRLDKVKWPKVLPRNNGAFFAVFVVIWLVVTWGAKHYERAMKLNNDALIMSEIHMYSVAPQIFEKLVNPKTKEDILTEWLTP